MLSLSSIFRLALATVSLDSADCIKISNIPVYEDGVCECARQQTKLREEQKQTEKISQESVECGQPMLCVVQSEKMYK